MSEVTSFLDLSRGIVPQESPQIAERNEQSNPLVLAKLRDTINRLLSAGVSPIVVRDSLAKLSREIGYTL